MNACEICQKVLLPDAQARGEAIQAKGKPVCKPCADRLGIPPDAEALPLPGPRSPTEAMIPAATPKAGGASGAVFASLGVAVLGCAGYGLWVFQGMQAETSRIQNRLSQLESAPSPRPDPGGEAKAQLRGLESQLAQAEASMQGLRAELEAEARRRAEMEDRLREEARTAREQASEARKASEAAASALDAEVARAVARALEAHPPEPAPAVANPLAEQYWVSCQRAVEALSRQGRYWPAAREFDRISPLHRRTDHDALAAAERKGLEARARERVDLALKVCERRIREGDYAFADDLLAQLEEECGFPALVDRLRPVRDEVRGLRKDQAAREARTNQEVLLDLGAEDPAVRQRAAASLVKQGKASLPLLFKGLSNPDPRVRWGSILALGELKAEDAVPGVAAALRDPDPRVRLVAADVLAEFKDPRALSALVAALDDEDEAVGRQAEVSLERITHFSPKPPPSGRPRDYAPAWKSWMAEGREAVQP